MMANHNEQEELFHGFGSVQQTPPTFTGQWFPLPETGFPMDTTAEQYAHMLQLQQQQQQNHHQAVMQQLSNNMFGSALNENMEPLLQIPVVMSPHGVQNPDLFHRSSESELSVSSGSQRSAFEESPVDLYAPVVAVKNDTSSNQSSPKQHSRSSSDDASVDSSLSAISAGSNAASPDTQSKSYKAEVPLNISRKGKHIKKRKNSSESNDLESSTDTKRWVDANGAFVELTQDEMILLSGTEVEVYITALKAYRQLSQQDEKVLRTVRRLIKNREYAQSSRDKKKGFVQNLQNRVSELEAEVSHLNHKNAVLQAKLAQIEELTRQDPLIARRLEACLNATPEIPESNDEQLEQSAKRNKLTSSTSSLARVSYTPMTVVTLCIFLFSFGLLFSVTPLLSNNLREASFAPPSSADNTFANRVLLWKDPIASDCLEAQEITWNNYFETIIYGESKDSSSFGREFQTEPKPMETKPVKIEVIEEDPTTSDLPDTANTDSQFNASEPITA